MNWPIKAVLLLGLLGTSACNSKASDDTDSCTPDDQDGVVGGVNKVLVSVSDTAFIVGGKATQDEPNITVQNSSTIELTITNTGTKPHSFKVQCIPTDLPASCNNPTSCFPDAANIPAIDPGDKVTVTFDTPVVEGVYTFTSDEPGDTETAADGTVTGLVGEFVLM